MYEEDPNDDSSSGYSSYSYCLEVRWTKGEYMNEKDYFEELQYLLMGDFQIEPDETAELDFSL